MAAAATSSFVPVSDFIINGVHVDASHAVFEHNNASGIANGRYLELKGALNLAEVFVAGKVELK